MSELLLAAYLCIGVLGGLCAGLFGIGGGAIFGPLLLLIADGRGLAAEEAIATAVATSIATVILTSIPSAAVHALHRNVDWRILRWLAPAAAVGAAAGAAALEFLHPVFPALLMMTLLIVGVRSLWRSAADEKSQPQRRPNRAALAGIGGVAGSLGAVTGSGGGLITVPLLVRFGAPLKAAIGTSAVIAMLVALCASGVLAGQKVDGPALAVIAAGCIVSAVLGARLATRLPVRILRWLFCGFLIAVCLRLGYWLFSLAASGGI